MVDRRTECCQKHEAVRQYLAAHRLEAVILTRRCNFAWFTGGGLNHVSSGSDVGAASLLVTPERVVCITNNIESPRIIAEELAEVGIEVRAHHWWDDADAARVWSAELGDRPAAVDALVGGISRDLPMLGGDFDLLRFQLNEAEIARYRQLGPEVAAALEQACKEARPGMTEHEFTARVSLHLRDRAIREPVILVANEDRVRRYRHPIPTHARINKYGMGVCCVERDGLFISVTRLFSFAPIDDDLKRRHQGVSMIDAAMIAATRPGATLGEIFAVCQKAYAEAGFPDEWQLHHQGGLMGYVARENRATPGSSIPVLPNQVYGWNPSIAGTKSEDTILVLPDRTEIFTGTGEWPTKPCTVGGRTWLRNEILDLSKI